MKKHFPHITFHTHVLKNLFFFRFVQCLGVDLAFAGRGIANVYPGCSVLDCLLDMFSLRVYVHLFLSHSDVGRATCFSSWVLRCKPDLSHLPV